MKVKSRTANSLKNSSVALILFVADLILQFFSRKIFLEYLGTEILGLNTTATNLLQFLNLAELGIGTAVGFSLYKPFYEKDEQTINEIVSLQGKLYKRIAYIVILGAIVLMSLFPLIFKHMKLPLWYAYASFGVLLFSSLLSYFVNYKQILLSADQKEYKIQYSYKATMLIKALVQILAIRYLNYGYFWWLILEVIFAVLASIVLNKTIKHTYPFIKNCRLSYLTLQLKYPIIKKKIKQVFVHRIGAFAVTQLSPLMVYAFTSLSIVALYGNYMLIVFGLARLSRSIFNGITAGIGNLVAEGKKDRIFAVFDEYFSVRFYFVAVMCFGMIILTQQFMQLWVGIEYLLSNKTLYLIIGFMYIYIMSGAVEAFLNAFGYYSDIFSPIIEIALGILLSIIFGHYWGLNGVLLGQLLSQLCIYIFWKPFFLFKIKLNQGYRRFILMYMKHIVIAILCYLVVVFIVDKFVRVDIHQVTLISFLKQGLIFVPFYSALLFVMLYFNNCGIKKFFLRMSSIIKRMK